MNKQSKDKNPAPIIFDGVINEPVYHDHVGKYYIGVKRTSVYGVEIVVMAKKERASYLVTTKTKVNGCIVENVSIVAGSNPVVLKLDIERYSDLVAICFMDRNMDEGATVFMFNRRIDLGISVAMVAHDEVVSEKPVDLSEFFVQGSA